MRYYEIKMCSTIMKILSFFRVCLNQWNQLPWPPLTLWYNIWLSTKVLSDSPEPRTVLKDKWSWVPRRENAELLVGRFNTFGKSLLVDCDFIILFWEMFLGCTKNHKDLKTPIQLVWLFLLVIHQWIGSMFNSKPSLNFVLDCPNSMIEWSSFMEPSLHLKKQIDDAPKIF